MSIKRKDILLMLEKYPNVTVNYILSSPLRVCGYCGCLFTPTHHSQKYCPDKECSKKHRRDYKADWIMEYRMKHPNWDNRIGTSNLSSHPNKDFDKEEKAVKHELRRMKKYQ